MRRFVTDRTAALLATGLDEREKKLVSNVEEHGCQIMSDSFQTRPTICSIKRSIGFGKAPI